MALIIVESPTKARTFNRILKGKDFFVFASFGHIRDLPRSKISVNYQKNFKPTYEILKNKNKVVASLKKLAKKNKEIILATDLDREGEAIAYHVAYILGFIDEKWPDFKIKNKKHLKRIVFHEITGRALKDALEKPTELRVNLVKAQQARRILDRVVGYELSPLLWKKIGKNWLSAGRVQTVALRIIVEREKEILKFKQESYFQINTLFKGKNYQIKAKLLKEKGIPFYKTAKINLFDGSYQFSKTTIDKKKLNGILAILPKLKFIIANVKENIAIKYPPPPFTTSLLQQSAFNRYGFSSRMTMKLAQDLYERGLITYHRTDSFNLASRFVFGAKDFITKKYGKKYALEKPRGYKTRSRSAQEAHEAIRPTKLEFDQKRLSKLTKKHKNLFNMIFNRALATQMKEAQVKETKIEIQGGEYLFESEAKKVVFDGFLKVLNAKFVKNNLSDIKVKKGDELQILKNESLESQTKPPYRYTEATLIKSLEKKSVGRPSTYAPIISLIQQKVYVIKKGRYFAPTKLGTAISDYLSSKFSNLFSLDFTAKMEGQLDDIANKKRDLIKTLSDFYKPLKKKISSAKKDKKVIQVENETEEKCPKCKAPLLLRFSRYGQFLGCSNYPKCKFTKTAPRYVKGKKCPKCEGRIVIKFTKTKKKFFGCENYPKCKYSSWTFNGIK